jgi:hypothetical protein
MTRIKQQILKLINYFLTLDYRIIYCLNFILLVKYIYLRPRYTELAHLSSLLRQLNCEGLRYRLLPMILYLTTVDKLCRSSLRVRDYSKRAVQPKCEVQGAKCAVQT